MIFKHICSYLLLETIHIIIKRLRWRWIRSIYLVIDISTILTIFLALFDNITKTKKTVDKLTCSTKNIFWCVYIILRDFHSFQYRRYKEQKHYSQNNTNDHKSDAIPSFFLVFFFIMRKNEHYDSADECINTSNEYQKNYQGQNCQNDILEISISINSIHRICKKTK